MGILYERTKTHHDRTVRCYLTLRCSRACPWCSAGVPGLPAARQAASLAPAVWAEGINRRGREVILCGGEPLWYEGLAELLAAIRRDIRIQVYTNLEPDVSALVAAGRPLVVLASLHREVTSLDDPWFDHARRLQAAGHALRVHVVKRGNWPLRRDLALSLGVKVTCCDDQTGYCKSAGPLGRPVLCEQIYYVFGPDGYRYPCVTLLGLGHSGREHISAPDGEDGLTTRCDRFGRCVGCDNLVEGRVTAEEDLHVP